MRMKDMLKKEVEIICHRRYIKKKVSRLETIKFKMNDMELNYDEKNNFLDYNINHRMRYFQSMINSQIFLRRKYFIRVRKKIVKNELKNFRKKQQMRRNQAAHVTSSNTNQSIVSKNNISWCQWLVISIVLCVFFWQI